MTNTEFLRKHILERFGLTSEQLPDLDELHRTQWCPEFEALMRNRLIMGFFRYGDIHKNNTTTERKIISMKKRLNLYEETGNMEHLVDLANLALVEFMHSEHPLKHFHTNGDDSRVGV